MLSESLLYRATENLQRDATFYKQRSVTESPQVRALGSWVYSRSGRWSLPAGSPTVEAAQGRLSCGWGTWHSCSLNSQHHMPRVGGRELISIHCTQLFIWKSTSNVPIHIALLHFSTFMSVIAFIFLVKTAKQVIIYYITAHIGWVYSHNSSNPP